MRVAFRPTIEVYVLEKVKEILQDIDFWVIDITLDFLCIWTQKFENILCRFLTGQVFVFRAIFIISIAYILEALR